MVGIAAVSLHRHLCMAHSFSIAPASLAQVAGAARMGERKASAVANGIGAQVAFMPASSARFGAMPPCSLHHRRASATAAHNRSIHADAQVLSAAARPRLMSAGDFQR
jgi:hypothetical protein